MIALLTVKHNIIKSLVDSLLNNKVEFEFNTMHRSFRIRKVSSGCYLQIRIVIYFQQNF